MCIRSSGRNGTAVNRVCSRTKASVLLTMHEDIGASAALDVTGR
jgi:hypothetical protein